MATPIAFTPMYIRQIIEDPNGFIVRAERWNALWNLNIQQGDNNSQGIDNLTKGYNALRADYDNTVANTYNKTAVDTLLAAKENKAVTATHVKEVTFDKNTGVFTFTKEDGSFIVVDTALERVAIDVRLDPVTSELVLTLADGTEQRVDLASFIDTYTFKDSATIIWSALGKAYTPQIKPGSILMEHLGIPLQDTLTGCVNAAAASASAAEQSKIAAAGSATNASASAADAQVSKNAAALSEANAKGSETAAAGSKADAAVSAQAAQTSALNSEASAVRSEDAARRAETIVGGDFATNTAFNAHTSDTNNPHSVTKAQVGLDKVDNTADANKPVSTAQQAAIQDAASSAFINAVNAIPKQNLLDNSDFSNPVNQRGQTFYAAAGHTVDRWLKDAAGTVTVSDGKIILTRSDATSAHYFYQRVPKEKVKSGNTYTLSVGLANGTVYTLTAVLASNVAEKITPFGRVTFVMLAGFAQVLIDYGKDSLELAFVKFEEGNVATPYAPKGYGVELAECLRYYQKASFFFVAATSSHQSFVFAPPMRISPSMTWIPTGADGVPTAYGTTDRASVWRLVTGTYATGILVASADL